MKTLGEDSINMEQSKYSNINIEDLLVNNKKVVAFLGSNESGTSFIINNLANLISSKGVNVAILDITKNKSSYYIYTKNEDSLRRIAFSSIENLSNGIADGIKVNENLTVYTALPGENKFSQEVQPILETLIKNHSLILIDCDLDIPVEYLEYAQEIYLIQSMNILQIQPLTEALAKFEEKGTLDIKKLRIIINKFMNILDITEREIIGGMAFYNEPSMSYMKQLFNKDIIKYMTIPFEEEIYKIYLQQVINCNINIREFPGSFLRDLDDLADNVYPIAR